MKPILTFILVLFFFYSETEAQIYPSVSNVLRYGTGERSLGNSKQTFKYFENLTDARLKLPNDLTVGVRFLYDEPPEIGIPFKGIQRRFIEYNTNDIYMRVGNFSELYGHGLAINLFESRGLAYDTWMDGFTGKYTSKLFNVSLIGGSLNFRDSITTLRNEDYKIRGGNFEVTPTDLLTLGLTYINTEGSFKLLPQNISIEADIPAFYLNLTSDDLTFLLDYSFKRTHVKTGNYYSNGFGIYGSLSYTALGLGITLDYKNYMFDERNPFERNDFSRPTRMLPFQNPPIVMKEHTYTLLTRALHQVDFNDEVGLQLEVYYSIDDETDLDFNTSLASRHNYYIYDAGNFSFSKEERSSNFLPSFNNKLSPYWEIFAEMQHYFNDETFLKAAFARRTYVLYNEFFPGSSHTILSTVIPLKFMQTVNDFYAFELEYEFEHVFDSYNSSQSKFYNQFLSLTNTLYSRLNMTVRYEFTDNDYDVSGRKDWVTVELGYRLSQNHNVTLSYGRERGGQICSNGVCRYLQPFEGFRFSIISNI